MEIKHIFGAHTTNEQVQIPPYKLVTSYLTKCFTLTLNHYTKVGQIFLLSTAHTEICVFNGFCSYIMNKELLAGL